MSPRDPKAIVDVPKETKGHHGRPEVTPDVPEIISKPPQMSPKGSKATPDVPEIMPKPPQMSPKGSKAILDDTKGHCGCS